MSRAISQQTFDDAVKESIEEFSMSPEEAIESTIQEFNAQGVNLQNIITNSLLTNEVDILTEKIKKLKALQKEDPELDATLKDIKDECDSGIGKRVLAGQCGLYNTLIAHLTQKDAVNESLTINLFETLISLVTGYPDLLDNDGLNIITSTLKGTANETLLILALKLSIESCIKHEINREKFITNADIMNSLKQILENDTACSEIIRTVCKLLQTFVLNDDIRAELPLAHQHACQIFTDFLAPLMDGIKKHKNDKNILASIMQVLSVVIVRNEFCQQFADQGGLETLREILLNFPEEESLYRSCFALIKVVAGNDQVKNKVMTIIEPALFVEWIQKFLNSPKTCNQELSTLSMLTLRNRNNCKLLAESNIAEPIVHALKTHTKLKPLVKNACWLIRNLIQANNQLTSNFLSLGAEDYLRKVLKEHEDCSFEANVALRLLGCEVEVKELWTGEGKGITN